MANVKLHNPELSKGSVLSNLVLEKFKTDESPTDSPQGRIWFDTDLNTFVGTISDSDNIISTPIGLDRDIKAETEQRIIADNNIKTILSTTQEGAGLEEDGSYIANSLSNYIKDATSLNNADKLLDTQIKVNEDAITSLDERMDTAEDNIATIGDLTTLKTDAKNTIVESNNELFDRIETEKSERIDATDNLSDQLLQEVSDRELADSEIQNELNVTQEGAGLEEDGTYSPNTETLFIVDASSLKDADEKLDLGLKTTIENYASTDEYKGSDLIGFDGYDEENDEIQNPVIELEKDTISNTIKSISSKVNEKFNQYDTSYVKGEIPEGEESDEYIISHNLGTVFVDPAIQVHDSSDDSWHFDLVDVEVIDENTIKVSMSYGSKHRIRYVIKGY